MNNVFQNPTATLQSIIVDLMKQYMNCKQIKTGIKQNLEALNLRIERIRRQADPAATKSIGFFGAQKRGKSSLINLMLGCNLMPVKINVASSVVIRSKQDNNIEPGKYELHIFEDDGFQEEQTVNLEDAQFLLKTYGSRTGGMTNVSEIHVLSNFPDSKILKNGGILVDTPGAESVFNSENDETSDVENASDKSSELNRLESERAFKILDSTQVIVFCERFDYMETRNSRILYQQKLKSRYPVNVLNFKDKYEGEDLTKTSSDEVFEQMKESKLVHRMAEVFGATLDRIVCVSSKEAKDAIKESDEELLKKSNIPKLEKFILDELQNFDPHYGLIPCLKDMKKLLNQINAGKTIITPDELFMHNFIRCIEKDSSYSETTKFAKANFI